MADLKVFVIVLLSLVIPVILQKCDERKDVVFLVDSSGSVKARNFQKVRTFVVDFVQKLDIGESKIRLSVVRFSSVLTKILWLDESFDKTEITNTIKAIKYNGGGTKTGEALRFANEKVLDVDNGDREEVSDLVFVITDGKSKNTITTQNEAKLLHDKGVDVVAIGVGSGVDVTELLNIASDKDFALRVDNFEQLKNETLHKKIFTAACTGLKPTTPVATTELLTEVSEALTSTESSVGNIEEISLTTSVPPAQTVQPSDAKTALTITQHLLVENTTVSAFSGGSLTSDPDHKIPFDSTIDLKQFTSTEQIFTDDTTTVEQTVSRQTRPTSSYTVTGSKFEDSSGSRTPDSSSNTVTERNFEDTSSHTVTRSNIEDSYRSKTPDTPNYTVTEGNIEDSESRTPDTPNYTVTEGNIEDSESRTPDTPNYTVTESNIEDSESRPTNTPNYTVTESNIEDSSESRTPNTSTSNATGNSNDALRLFKDWKTVAGLTSLSGLVIVASLGGIILAVRKKKNSNMKEIKQYD